MYRQLLAGLGCLGLAACSHVSAQEIASSTPMLAITSLSLDTSLAAAGFPANIDGAIAASSLPSLNAEALPYELLQVRKYHGDEVVATSGEQWWSLFVTDDGFELLPTTITVNTIRDGILDMEGDEFTGKEIVTDNDAMSMFLVKGPDFLTSGMVKTVFAGSVTVPRHLPQQDRLSSLSVVLNADEASKIPIHYRFQLTEVDSADTLQTILTFSEDGEGKKQEYRLDNCCDWTGPSLLWAGDLDRDGRLDFLLDTSRHYNVSEPTLFLSSLAREGEIARPVARRHSVGG
ncbi:hypothetical protein SPB21_00200 [Leptothoe sp. ISB3NOV94-8A]